MYQSLNHVYRLVWSKAQQAWVVASELSKGHTKQKTGRASRPLLALAFSGALLPSIGLAGPQLNSVQQGQGQVTHNGNITTINQQSQQLSLDWQSFNVQANEQVNFAQPNRDAIAINHINDTNGSQIHGQINANGQVWLLNPNGVLFGKDAQVNVGGIVASSLALSNKDDVSAQFNKASEGGKVLNFGNIKTTPGGYIALISEQVTNHGSLQSNGGNVSLGAGSTVNLTFAGHSLLSLDVPQSRLDNLVDNQGLIQAQGGKVLMNAGAKDSLLASVVNNDGIIEARGMVEKDGEIILLSGMAAGTTQVSGTLDASASDDAAKGGFIETSGQVVNVANNTNITTVSSNGNGLWLVDPDDYKVAASGANITGTALSGILATTDHTIQTTSGGTGGSGDIIIDDEITWSSSSRLTLDAYRNIEINQSIRADSAGKLSLLFGQGGPATSDYSLNTGAQINLPAGLNFSTKLGSNAVIEYQVITDLGTFISNDGLDLQGIGGSLVHLAKNYALGANIDATDTAVWDGGKGFQPLGSNAEKFSGRFSGLGHSIDHLRINRVSDDYLGLFGAVDGASIRDLGLKDVSVQGSDFIGGLVGSIASSTLISNSFVEGVVNGTGGSVGGLVGNSQSSTLNSNNTEVSVSGGNNVGGLAGLAMFSTLDGNYSVGSTTGSDKVGGLVGFSSVTGISTSYASGAVSGNDNVGGLVGQLENAIVDNSYASGTVTGTSSNVGGFAGKTQNMTVNNSYALGNISCASCVDPSKVGGFIGSASITTVNNSFWDLQGTGLAASSGSGEVGVNTGQMQTLDTFNSQGWNIDALGGTGKTWRIYPGFSTPLLRRYLTPFNAQPVFDGSAATFADIAAVDVSAAQSGKLLGTASVSSELLISSPAADSYTLSSQAIDGLYSHQQGYDIRSDRKVSTVGSSAGQVLLANPLNWQSGQLTFEVSGAITPVAINGGSAGVFEIKNGSWLQVSQTLADFNVDDFRLTGGRFLRAESGSGSSADPYSLTDIYAVQGIDTDLNKAYQLTTDIDAQGTLNWHTGAGFSPIGQNTVKFTGQLDGLGHRIDKLTINRGAQSNIGLIGKASNASIKDIGLSNVAITGQDFVGALVGLQDSNTQISNSYVTGAVAGEDRVGGLVGYIKNGDVNDSYSESTANGVEFVGGLVGELRNNSSSVSDSYATGAIAGGSRVGGLIGYQAVGSDVSDSYATGAVTGNLSGTSHELIGGLIGEQSDSTLSGSYASGEVVGAGDSTGGLVGYLSDNSTIDDSYASGNVTSVGNSTGGLVGYQRGTSQIKGSYAVGNINSQGDKVGGLVGNQTHTSSIDNSYAVGSVKGGEWVGGLVGYLSNSVSNSFATGVVEGVTSIGGLIGNNAGGTVNSSFWDTQKSGLNSSDGGIGKNSQQIQQAATFSGWDIDDEGGTAKVWRIYEGHTTPLLRSFLTPLDRADKSVSFEYTAAPQSVQNSDLGANLYGFGSITQTDVGNYTLALYSDQQGYDLSGSASLNITPKPITFSAEREYDATTALALTGLQASGKVVGDVINYTGQVSFNSKDSGTQILNVAGLTLDNSNYRIADSGHTGIITPKSITLNAHREYDGHTELALALLNYQGLLADDQLTLTGTASVPSADAGSYQMDTSALNIGNANYTIGASSTVIIDPKKIQLTAQRVYDGSTNIGLQQLNYSGLLTGDTLDLAGTASIASADKGSYQIDTSALALGNLNYAIGDGGTAIIDARQVQLSARREYDGTSDIALAALDYRNLVSGDSLNVLGSASVAASDVGEYALNTSALSFANDNYVVDDAGSIASIEARQVQLFARREYDGTNQLDLDLLQADHLIAGDQLDLTGSVSLAAKNAGDQVINTQALTVSNANYRLAGAHLAEITKKTLQVHATVADKAFDNQLNANVDLSGSIGLIAGDRANLAYTSAEFAALVGNDLVVTVQGIQLLGQDAKNYQLSTDKLTTTASISNTVEVTSVTGALLQLGNEANNQSAADEKVPAKAKRKRASQPEVVASRSEISCRSFANVAITPSSFRWAGKLVVDLPSPVVTYSRISDSVANSRGCNYSP